MKEPVHQPRRIDPARLMAVIALWLITAVSFLVFFDRTGYLQLTRNWLFLLAVGLCCAGAYFRSPPRGLYLLGPVFLLWLALTALIRGDSTLGQLPAQTALVEQSIIFCVAFPFARLIRDPDRQQLNRLLLAVVCLMAVMIWLCLIGTLTGRNISLFRRLVFGASYTATGRLKLKVLNLHYYHLGYLSVICFFITLYLAASRPRARWRPLWLLLLATFAAAILKHSFSLFADSGRSVPVRLLTLIPIALTLMNVFDCLFPFESRVPLLIPLLHALVSGCIVEICRKPTGQPA